MREIFDDLGEVRALELGAAMLGVLDVVARAERIVLGEDELAVAVPASKRLDEAQPERRDDHAHAKPVLASSPERTRRPAQRRVPARDDDARAASRILFDHQERRVERLARREHLGRVLVERVEPRVPLGGSERFVRERRRERGLGVVGERAEPRLPGRLRPARRQCRDIARSSAHRSCRHL